MTATPLPSRPTKHPSLDAILRSPTLSRHEKLTQLGQKIVAGTFYGTLLKQMRQSPFRSELFGGGRAEQAYGPMYDQQMADRMARGSGQKLVRSLVKSIERSSSERQYRRAGAKKEPAGLLGEVKG